MNYRSFFKIPIIVFLTGITRCVSAQQTPVSEMYLIDYVYANPAEVGRRNCMISRLSDIHQWVGITDAPNLQSFLIHKGFRKEHHTSFHGLGGLIYRDQNGHYGSTGIKAMYSFHVQIIERNKTYVSFGLAGEYAQRSLNENGFLNYNSDPALTGSGQSAWNPNVDFGVLLSNKKFSSGIAVLDLLPPLNSISDPVSTETRNRKYSIYFSKIMPLRHELTAEPSLMIKASESLFSQVDFNLKLYYKEWFWGGLSYRHSMDEIPGKPIGGIIYLGILLNNWSVDYSFAFNLGALQKVHYGTHGLVISYKICPSEKGSLPCPAYR